MITMPDGAKFEMQWKQVKYLNGGHTAAFEIVPMNQGKDIVLMPTAKLWGEAQNVFSAQERLEIIVLLERIAWKRDIRVVEVNIEPDIDSNAGPVNGSLESTPGYREMTSKNLFDPQSPLSKEQAKEIYCILEKRFAEGASGVVTIPKGFILHGSVLAEISIPALERNPNEKVTENGQEYAKVGDRLYSKHAVNRMQPSGNRFGPNIYLGLFGEEYGRSLAPQFVEDVIRSANPFVQDNGNLVYISGTVKVVTNKQGAVITVVTYLKK